MRLEIKTSGLLVIILWLLVILVSTPKLAVQANVKSTPPRQPRHRPTGAGEWNRPPTNINDLRQHLNKRAAHAYNEGYNAVMSQAGAR